MRISFLFLAFVISLALKAAPPVEEGKTIFTSRCATCHNVNKQVLGPALAGVDERRSMDWIINFVQSSQTFIKHGDKDAAALFKQFNNIPMPDHKDLSADQIKNVVAYIKEEANAASTAKSEDKSTKQPVPSVLDTIWSSPSLLVTFSLLAVLLVGSLLLAYRVKQYSRSYTAQK